MFIVENATNTCYIDSLLMSLFYIKSGIESLLQRDIESGESLLLQDYIYNDFVKQVRSNNSILEETMSTIRYYAVRAGWLHKDGEVILNEVLKQQDVSEFYMFLMQEFKGPMIEVCSKKDKKIHHLPFIPLHLNPGEERTNVKTLLRRYLYDGETEINSIINIIEFIPVYIHRFIDHKTRVDVPVDINKKLKPFIGTENSDLGYLFHSVVCYTGKTPEFGHYYSVLYDHQNNKWMLFDDKNVPGLLPVNMSDDNIIKMIELECVFIIYRSVL